MCLLPYLGGEDLNLSPTQTAPRWVINFFDWPEREGQGVPRLLRDCRAPGQARAICEQTQGAPRTMVAVCRDVRSAVPRDRRVDTVVALCQTATSTIPVVVSADQVFSHKVVVFLYGSFFEFGWLSSGVHLRWSYRYGSTLGNSPVYTPSMSSRPFRPQPTRVPSHTSPRDFIWPDQRSALHWTSA